MDLHTNSMVIFHSFLYVYQRVMFPNLQQRGFPISIVDHRRSSHLEPCLWENLINDWRMVDMDGYGRIWWIIHQAFYGTPLVPTTTTHQQPTTTDSAARTKCSAPRRGPTKQKKPRTFRPWKDGRIFRGGSRLHRCR